MNQRKHGQSIIEYSIILILVVLGIVVMGPYVLRSINGHFKLWDDQVQDSFNDRLVQAPATDVDLPPNCSIVNGQENIAGSCGIVKGKTVTCQENERYYYANFNPPGCYIAESCVPDADCCNPAVRGDCGRIERPVVVRTATIGMTFKGVPVLQQVPANPATGTPKGCYFGEREIRQRCGNANAELLGCIVDTYGREFDARNVGIGTTGPIANPPDNSFGTADDDPSCAAMCLGSFPAHSVECHDYNIDVPRDMLFTTDGDTCPANLDKCKFRCVIGYSKFPSLDPSTQCVYSETTHPVAAIITNGRNDQSYTICSPDGARITTADLTGSGCLSGNPSGATPSAPCITTIK
jgi:hypothetical protein